MRFCLQMEKNFVKNKELEELLRETAPQVIAWRRQIHCNPELSFQEYETSHFIEEKLRSFGNIEVFRPTKTGVVGVLHGKSNGKTIGFRADIDALPIQEDNDLPFRSQNAGIMHACGHDGHTALLLGAAKILSSIAEELQGTVLFVFQHAEEVPPGGAIEMVKAGVTADADEMYGVHLSSSYPTGKFGICYGPLTAATDKFSITVMGKGGHSALPEQCVDPIVTSAQIILALQTILSRNISAFDSAVLSVCKTQAGETYNIIPDEMTMIGSVRTFLPEIRNAMPIKIERIVKGLTQANGADYSFSYEKGYDSVINDHNLTSEVVRIIRERFGKEYIQAISPVMPGEDFSAFTKNCPGCFIEIGTENQEKGTTQPQHNAHYKMDEDALLLGTKLFVQIACDRLK